MNVSLYRKNVQKPEPHRSAVMKTSSPCLLTLLVPPRRPEAVEVGGSSRRLDPRPRRQDAAQEEDHVQQEEDVWPSQSGRQAARGEEEEEVAAAVPRGFLNWPAASVLFGRPGFVVSLADAVDARPLVWLVVNWEERRAETGFQRDEIWSEEEPCWGCFFVKWLLYKGH